MTWSLAILCIAAAAIISFTVSGLVAVGLAATRRTLDSCCPDARARVLLCLALLPVFVTVAVMAAALAPSFGWITDHCTRVVDLHAHPHLCAHHEGVLPALPITALAALFVARWLIAGTRLLALGGSALRTERALMREAKSISSVGAHVLPIDEPQAFVLGVIRPVLFVTRGLFAPEHRVHMQTVLAHERAHLLRGDPLRRLIASIGFAFHLPWVARAIERQLSCAHEMAADEDAAKVVGSRERVARALVHLTRVKANARRPRMALAFGDSDVEVRVRALLEPRPRIHEPRLRTLMAIAMLALVVVAGGADGVHHGIEMTLGLLYG